MQIVSKYQKKLSFPDMNLTMSPNQVITVKDEVGIELIKNPWIIKIKTGSPSPTFGCCGVPFDQRKPAGTKVEIPNKETVKSVHVPIKNVEIEEKIEKEKPKKEKITIEEKQRSNQDKTIKD